MIKEGMMIDNVFLELQLKQPPLCCYYNPCVIERKCFCIFQWRFAEFAQVID